MSELRKKIGQCFIIAFDGIAVPAAVASLIRDHHVGGVILFASNCPTLHRARDLVRELKSFARGAPLCVAIDHEGGRIHRLPKPATHFPPMRTLGKLYERMPSSTLALEVGRVMGAELKSLGIDWNFAPVVDVDTNPSNPVIGDRSFSNNPSIVAQVAAQMIQGMESEGVAACAKHFPGHGDTDGDSHQTLPSLPHNLLRLEALELVPFKAAIRQKVASIMTAHVVYNGIDKNTPATFSVKILRDLLRTELGYSGIIVSDSLDMGAVAGSGTLGDRSVRAFRAGCDWLIVGKDPEKVPLAIDAFEKAIADRLLPLERVKDSVDRISRFKEQFCNGSSEKGRGKATPNPKRIGLAEHKEILSKIKALS